jgi:hypothetical protein
MQPATKAKTGKRAAKSRGKKADPTFAEKTTGKVVRDSFSMIERDYALIAKLKARCLDLGLSVNKSQILRAGLNALDGMSDKNLTDIIVNLAEVKTGRPR